MSANHYSWSNPRVLLTFSLIFLCGALVGAIATLSTQTQVYTASSPAALDTELTVERLTAELALSEAQQERLRVVLDDHFQYYHALQDQIDEVKASGKDKINQLLTTEQKAKFREMLSRVPAEVR